MDCGSVGSGGGQLLSGHDVSLCGDENVCELDRVSCTTL